ncbi:MAG TPA: hypothetical protein VGA99_02500 [bacterium]
MKKQSFVIMAALIIASTAYAQDEIQPQLLIDLPTAATLDRGSYAIDLRLFGNGGLLGNVGVGITPRFMFGLSYGGENIVGEGGIDWNPRPGIQGRFRIIDETYGMPAITLGFDSQGFGAHVDTLDRYINKSRGLFAVASKNYAFLYNLGFHGGINYSLEGDDNDEDLNFFFGADLSFNREIRVMAEYDLARNDNENDQVFGSGDGYLNAGARWSISDRFFLQFTLKNLFKNGPTGMAREIKIGYFEYF